MKGCGKGEMDEEEEWREVPPDEEEEWRVGRGGTEDGEGHGG